MASLRGRRGAALIALLSFTALAGMPAAGGAATRAQRPGTAAARLHRTTAAKRRVRELEIELEK